MSTQLPDGRLCTLGPDRLRAILTYIALAAEKLPDDHPAWVKLMEAGTMLIEDQQAQAAMRASRRRR